MTDYQSPSGPPYSAVRIRTPDGSPRWLQIVRDALLSVAALIFIFGAILTAVALNNAGNALDKLGTPDPSPTAACYIVDDPSCVQPGD